MNEKNRVLAIGMVDSEHFARWLSGACGSGFAITIMPSGPNRRVHPVIRKLLKDHPHIFDMSEALAKWSMVIWIVDRIASERVRGHVIRKHLEKPFDVIHFHEMQSGGYPLRHVPNGQIGKRLVVYTPYGSDLFWFQKYPQHRRKISAILRLTDAIFPECERDLVIAKELGFRGKELNTLPASGWRQIAENPNLPFTQRNKVVIKAYGGKWGEIEKVISVLSQSKSLLETYELHFVSTSIITAMRIRTQFRSSPLRLVIHRKYSLSFEDMLRLFSEAKYYIALSKSDGFPASLFEAVSNGAIPIQSNTACIPKSLEEISPENFISPNHPMKIIELLRFYEKSEILAKKISNDFMIWSHKNQHLKSALPDILLSAYNVKT